MAFSRSVFTVLLISVVCKASNVPVYLWGGMAAPKMKSNPLTTTTSPAFSIILSDQLAENPFTVVFIEKTLSIEDFSHRNAEGKTSFPYLYENLKKSLFLPSVENAMDALNLFEDPKKVTLTELGLSEEIIPVTGKFLFISMEDAREGESRDELLRRHNDFMKATVLALQKERRSVVAVYTAIEESWVIPHSRIRRQAADSNITEYILDGLRLYARSIRLVDGTNTVELQGLSSFSSDINTTALTLKTTLTFPSNSIVLNFKGVSGYWFFGK